MMMEEPNQAAPPPMPEEPDLFADEIKALVESLSPPDQDMNFYAEGLESFAARLDSKEIRTSFKKNNGFSVLIRNQKIGGVMAKVIDEMFLDEMKVLKAAYILCKRASHEHKDNAVRSLQIRGVLDNVFEMICTEKRVPDDVRIEGIRHAITVLTDTNVCKLMCNKYDLTNVEKFDSDYGDFGRHDICANFWRLLKTGGSEPVQAEAYKLVDTICACPRLYARVVDQDDAKLDKLAQAAMEGLVSGSQQPVSFGAYCRAVSRLCQHTRIRAALMRRQVPLLDAVGVAMENLLDEVSKEGTESLGQLFGCLAMLLLDMQPSEEVLERCGKLSAMVNRVLESNKAAETRRWARAAATALEMRHLEERPADMFEACRRLFLEFYDALYNKTDEFKPTPQVIAKPQHLLELFNGTTLFDAPHLFYAGAFRCLGQSVASVRGKEELYEKYKEKGGFDMMVRHRAIPQIMKTPLKEMRHERYTMMGIWAMGLDIMPENRDTVIRYIQMPNVIEHAVAMIHEPNSYPAVMRILSLEVLCFVCDKQDICRMVCNKQDFPEFMTKLFSITITTEEADKVEEMQYKLFKLLTQCPKLAYRLIEEPHYENVIAGFEELILDGWSRPVVFRRLLECARLLVGNARLRARPWHREGMMDAVQTAVGVMLTMADGVPDAEAAVNLVRLADLLLKRERNEELLGSLRMAAEADYLPDECRAKAAESVREITFQD